MRPITVSVGPLAAASATKVATAQRNYGAGGALALIGTASSPVSTTVAASQAPGSAALTINGTLASSGAAYLPNQYIYITSSGDDHSITFAVVGLSGINNIRVTETIAGTNAQSAASVNTYSKILSITPSGAVAANVTVGSYTTATLDTPRHVLFTTTADESANTATITGTTWGGTPATEVVKLVLGGTIPSVMDYLTVSSVIIANAAAGNISLGTTTTAASEWVRLDQYAGPNASVQCTLVGTANYTVQTSNDDPNLLSGAIAPQNMTWLSSLDTNVVAASASQSSFFQYIPVFARVQLNSETGTGNVTMTVVQGGVAPY